MSAATFTAAAFRYFAAHGIDPSLAASLGVRERSCALVFPCCDANGAFERVRPLGDGPAKVRQPRGRALCCWWPAGRDDRAAVLVCEGESDALAALTAMHTVNGHPIIAEILDIQVVS